MDHLTKERRSWNMAQIRSKDTKPEIIVRSFLHKHGLRFRIKNKLIGSPDIYLKKYNTVIFVHGCFWHRHTNCKRATIPKSNTEYWLLKFQNNIKRDKLVSKALKKQGYQVFIIWECQIKNEKILNRLLNKIIEEL